MTQSDPSEARPRVLAFSAHAADFCSRSGGTLAKYASHGSAVRVVDLTFGERGESGGLWRSASPPALADAKRIREKEARAAASILGVDIRFLDWDDYPLDIDRPRLVQLAQEIRDWRPNIVLSHWTQDPLNQDHQFTGRAVIRACSVCAAPGLESGLPPVAWPEIFLFESGVPQTDLNGFAPDTYVDITESFPRKLEALKQLAAQAELASWYTQYGEWRAWQARTYTGRQTIRYAEAFKRFRPRVAEWLD
jgi:4-oxalomesaconate hydratase